MSTSIPSFTFKNKIVAIATQFSIKYPKVEEELVSLGAVVFKRPMRVDSIDYVLERRAVYNSSVLEAKKHSSFIIELKRFGNKNVAIVFDTIFESSSSIVQSYPIIQPDNKHFKVISRLEIGLNGKLFEGLRFGYTGLHGGDFKREIKKLSGDVSFGDFYPLFYAIVTSVHQLKNGLKNDNNLPTVSHRYISDCISKKEVLPIEEYIISATDDDGDKEGIFNGLVFYKLKCNIPDGLIEKSGGIIYNRSMAISSINVVVTGFEVSGFETNRVIGQIHKHCPGVIFVKSVVVSQCISKNELKLEPVLKPRISRVNSNGVDFDSLFYCAKYLNVGVTSDDIDEAIKDFCEKKKLNIKTFKKRLDNQGFTYSPMRPGVSTIESTFDKSTCAIVASSGLSEQSLKRIENLSAHKLPIISVAWIVESSHAGQLLPFGGFELNIGGETDSEENGEDESSEDESSEDESSEDESSEDEASQPNSKRHKKQ